MVPVEKMWKLLLRLGLVLLALNCVLTSCEGLGEKGEYDERYNDAIVKSLIHAATAKLNEDLGFGPGRGLGLTAWEIIIVAVCIILGIMGMYYISICYPILCQKPRTHDKMGVPIV